MVIESIVIDGANRVEDLTGKQFGPYRILAPLGEGGMAAVYKAFQPGVDRIVALKVLPRHFVKDPQFVDRFEREAKVLARLQHPHILPIHDFGQADGYTYIVMPLIESGDLAALMQEREFSLAEICRIMTQVGDALDYAHTQGIIHRDVKPSNILVDQRGNSLLTDFGLAKIVSGYTNKLTASGLVVGTPEYMSPEQGMSVEIDGRCDIYAMGVILYELATGQVPFSAGTPVAVIFKHVNDPLPRPRQIEANISEPVEQVILKAMAKQPADRYATAGEMTRALQAALGSTASAAVVTAEPDENRTIILADAGCDEGSPSKVTTKLVKASASGFSRAMRWGLGSIAALILIGALVLGGRFIWISRANRTPSPAAAPQRSSTEPWQQPSDILPTTAPSLPSPLQPTLLPTAVVRPTATARAAQPETPPTNAPPTVAARPPESTPSSPPDQSRVSGSVQEALDACQGAVQGQACTVLTPKGKKNGKCRSILKRLICVPLDSPNSP